MADEALVEFLALLLLVPFISMSEKFESPRHTDAPTPMAVYASEAPRFETIEGRSALMPPSDQTLTMTVVEHRSDLDRAPASLKPATRRIDVIVTAP